MDQTKTKEARYAAPGVAGAAPLAVRGEPRGLVARARDGLVGWAKTAAITLGAMYVIGWFVLTVGVAWMNRANPNLARFENTVQKHFAAEVMRPYALPRDRAVTVEEAGRAFLALQPAPSGGNGFILKQPPPRTEVPWRGMVMAPELFPEARASSYEGPSSTVIDASARGFTRHERDVLRMIATAPLWRDWDIVTRAPAIDLVGARFETPFGPEARVAAMPILRFAATKEFAYAAVSRAAWHQSEGRSDSAEAVLRAIVSYGLMLTDNSTFVIDQLIGDVIVGIGRDALVRHYALAKDPRGPAIAQVAERARKLPPPVAAHTNVREYNARVAAIESAMAAKELSRGLRMEMVWQRAQVSCGDARELAFGHRAATTEVFDRARRDLARYPSERAVIDLMERSMSLSISRRPGSHNVDAYAAFDLLGRIYFNPRLANCSVAGLGAGF